MISQSESSINGWSANKRPVLQQINVLYFQVVTIPATPGNIFPGLNVQSKYEKYFLVDKKFLFLTFSTQVPDKT